ncbi:hypothetical protein GUJ93_ZPchr0010g7277 [Zizania palustris]|uniref:Uncharacterized protein n=1 Tax=Zizania palustris TaxID=103762 RepID=A0A8J5W901_ZIZPA|nr:hypothetical protein GUJ93_ZPchr0010g8817 [Zizania palustris]KAG8084977.1 hypothetical protein GUJ93_ZPchr0010g7277 [Zizania palustris]
MELATSTSACVCSAYRNLSTPAAAEDGDGAWSSSSSSSQLPQQRRRRRGGTKPAELRRRCYAVLKRQRTRLYILRRCVCMLVCWHEHDLSD